jgi:hypothetical protein
LVCLLLASAAIAQPPAPSPDWTAWQPLLGTWIGVGGGGPGEGTGGFTYALDLQNRVIVRRNHADYPAAHGRPAFSHTDLMIVTQPSPSETRADYYDNEGHVIRYGASWSPDGRTLTLVSDAVPGAPRFRLTQALNGAGADTLAIRFEIASPARPDSFTTYIEAKARKSP